MAMTTREFMRWADELPGQMGLRSATEMVFLDQIYRRITGGSTLPFDYNHKRDCYRLFGVSPDDTIPVPEGGLVLIV